jgi:hypothetical protein
LWKGSISCASMEIPASMPMETILSRILGSHSGENKDDCLLGYSAM